MEEFQKVERKLPVNYLDADISLFKNELIKIFPLSKIVELKYFIVHANGTLIYHKNVSIQVKEKSNFRIISPIRLFFLSLKKLFEGKFVIINSLSVWFTDGWSSGYFHWMLDALPRLLESNVEKETTILLPSHLFYLQYVLPSLNALGYHNVRCMQPTKYYLFKHLLINTHSAPTGNYNEKTVRRLREIFTKNLKDNSLNFGERIFVSRSQAERRKIINESHLHAVLDSFGFLIVNFEDYSWNQQVSICSNAKCLVGLHGAGLSNMLFMQENSVILELRKIGDSQNNCYFSLASALGHLYYYLQCITDTDEILNANFTVDEQKFEQLLQRIFSSKQSM